MGNNITDRNLSIIEIDLSLYWKELLELKWISALVMMLSISISFLFYIVSDKRYEVEVTFLVANASSTDSTLNLPSGISSLAGIAGVNLNTSQQTASAMAELKSKKFIVEFVTKYDLDKFLLAGKLDSTNQKMIIDNELYNTTTQEWVRTRHPGDKPTPTEWEKYEAFNSIISFKEDKNTGIQTLILTWKDPVQALAWASLFLKEADARLKSKELIQAKKTIEYLSQEIDKTPLIKYQNIFYKLVEEQNKILMLADTRDYFVFKIIDPAITPTQPTSPKAPKILALGVFVGILLITFSVLIKYWRKNASSI